MDEDQLKEPLLRCRKEFLETVQAFKDQATYSTRTYGKLDVKIAEAMQGADRHFSSMEDQERAAHMLAVGADNHWWAEYVANKCEPGSKQEKIGVSVSETQKLLLDSWAEEDGKSLSGVAAEAMAIGLAQLRKEHSDRREVRRHERARV